MGKQPTKAEYKYHSNWILEQLGYDITGNVNEQFMLRHKERLIDNPPPKHRKVGRKRKYFK